MAQTRNKQLEAKHRPFQPLLPEQRTPELQYVEGFGWYIQWIAGNYYLRQGTNYNTYLTLAMLTISRNHCIRAANRAGYVFSTKSPRVIARLVCKRFKLERYETTGISS